MNSSQPVFPYQQTRDRGLHNGSMFTRITKRYDLLNHLLSLGYDLYWRNRLIQAIKYNSNLSSNPRFVDLAAGTLDVDKELQKNFPQASIMALDISLPMIKGGLSKINQINFLGLCANAKEIPIQDKSIDAITIAFGIRNISPRLATYKEILRILVPGGKLYILEFGSGKQKIWGGVYNFYLNFILPQIGRLISGDYPAYKYLSESIKNFPKANEMQAEIFNSGFHRVTYETLTSGIAFIHIATKSPSLI